MALSAIGCGNKELYIFASLVQVKPLRPSARPFYSLELKVYANLICYVCWSGLKLIVLINRSPFLWVVIQRSNVRGSDRLNITRCNCKR
jgi:hypothetical protein